MKLAVLDENYFNDLDINSSSIKNPAKKKIYGASKKAACDQPLKTTLITSKIQIPSDLSLIGHGNSLVCPKNIIEITPVIGCHLDCKYCLVSAQEGLQKQVHVFKDYPKWLSAQLHKNANSQKGSKLGKMYYLSPKTEIFSPYTVSNGLAQSILSVFADFVEKQIRQNGECLDTLFIVTKAGIQELDVKDKDRKTVRTELKRIPNHVQISTSIAPYGSHEEIRKYMEPGARSMKKRLQFILELQKEGILANGALAEPLLFPFAYNISFYKTLRQYGIKRISFDLLTSTYENLAVVFQIIGHFDKQAERELWSAYLSTDAPPKSGGRITVSITKQREVYTKVIQVAKKAGIEAVTYCMFAERNIRLNKSEYTKSGCMANVAPHPKTIKKARNKIKI